MIENKEIEPATTRETLKQETYLFCQKEYAFVEPNSRKPILRTENVGPCYAITLYHPALTGGIHWDDNTNRKEINRVVDEFLKQISKITRKKCQPSDCRVTLSGGWGDHEESRKTGEFLKGYFKKRGFDLALEGYQEKVSVGEMDQEKACAEKSTPKIEFEFSSITIDSRTGNLICSDDWEDELLYARWNGAKAHKDLKAYLNSTHLQDEKYEDSGSSLIPAQKFKEVQQLEALALSKAAADNNTERLLDLLQHGITNPNMSPEGTKGWAPLHCACKNGHQEAAKILIFHGASISQKNDKGKSPLKYMKDKGARRQLEILGKGIKNTLKADGTSSLLNFSLFSRRPQQLKAVNPDTYEAIKSRKEKIEAIPLRK